MEMQMFLCVPEWTRRVLFAGRGKKNLRLGGWPEVAGRQRVAAGRVDASRGWERNPATTFLAHREGYAIFHTVCTDASIAARGICHVTIRESPGRCHAFEFGKNSAAGGRRAFCTTAPRFAGKWYEIRAQERRVCRRMSRRIGCAVSNFVPQGLPPWYVNRAARRSALPGASCAIPGVLRATRASAQLCRRGSQVRATRWRTSGCRTSCAKSCAP